MFVLGVDYYFFDILQYFLVFSGSIEVERQISLDIKTRSIMKRTRIKTCCNGGTLTDFNQENINYLSQSGLVLQSCRSSIVLIQFLIDFCLLQ